jgi:hypothetical protein
MSFDCIQIRGRGKGAIEADKSGALICLFVPRRH